MPRYDYDCAACGTRFEVSHGVTADPPTDCPVCGGGPIKKAFAPPTIHFKGSGWAKKERRAAVGTAKTAAEDGTPATVDAGAGKTGDAGKAGDAGKGDAGAKATDKPDKAPAPAATGPAGD